MSHTYRNARVFLVCICALATLGFEMDTDTSPSQTSSYDADPHLDQQSWFRALHLGKSWDIATGRGVTIADCAAGFYVEEAELAENLLVEYKYDLSDRDNPRTVNDGKFVFQGTASAAIMVSSLDGEGTNGIAFNAKVIPLQNFNYEPELDDIGKEEATADCVRLAIKIEAVDIILIESQTTSGTIGSSEAYIGTRRAVSKAVRSGIIVVSAAGDYSKELKTEAEDDSGSIIVGALRKNLFAANFSNYGDRVTVSAIGEGVQTIGGPFGRIRHFAQTPAAAAQVAGAIALALESNPNLTPYQVRELLIETRIRNINNDSVGGMIDVEKFVISAKLAADLSSDIEQMKSYRKKLIFSERFFGAFPF